MHGRTRPDPADRASASLVVLRLEEVRMPVGEAWDRHVDEVRSRVLGEAPISDPETDERTYESVYRMTQLADQVFPRVVKVPAVRIADWESGAIYDVQLAGEGDDLHACGFSVMVADEGDVEGPGLLTRAEAVLIAKRCVRGELPAAGVVRRRARTRRPDLAAVAAAYRDAETARRRRQPGEPQVSIRRHLQRLFDADSPQTVDGWIRAARDAGLLPPATTGRPRPPQAPED